MYASKCLHSPITWALAEIFSRRGRNDYLLKERINLVRLPIFQYWPSRPRVCEQLSAYLCKKGKDLIEAVFES